MTPDRLQQELPLVAVCIATCQRPAGLAATIEGLAGMRLSGLAAAAVEIIVVDNSPSQRTRAVCEALASISPYGIRYIEEPRRGIAAARNRAVSSVSPSCEFIAFIDDDECPVSEWLDELLTMQGATGADVVTGPVIPELGADTPAWVVDGHFHDRPRYPNGTAIDFARTGNVLVRAELLRALPFDERTALAGGEDTLLFARLRENGCRFVWADRAVVHETIPPSRTTAAWILLRAFRLASTEVMTDLAMADGSPARIRHLARGFARLGVAAAIAPLALLRSFGSGFHHLVAVMRLGSRGAGLIAGCAGKNHDEYRRIHGS